MCTTLCIHETSFKGLTLYEYIVSWQGAVKSQFIVNVSCDTDRDIEMNELLGVEI